MIIIIMVMVIVIVIVIRETLISFHFLLIKYIRHLINNELYNLMKYEILNG